MFGIINICFFSLNCPLKIKLKKMLDIRKSLLLFCVSLFISHHISDPELFHCIQKTFVYFMYIFFIVFCNALTSVEKFRCNAF